VAVAVAVAVAVEVAVAVGVDVAVAVGVEVAVAVGVEVAVAVAVAVGVEVAVAVAVGVGEGTAVKFPASAPMSVGLRDARVSPSKSFVTDAIKVPFPSMMDCAVGLICRSPVAAVPVGARNIGSSA
jgi:hypothetical protein